MQYMLLIYHDEAEWERSAPTEREALVEQMRAFAESLVKSGHYKAADRLAPSSSASVVRVRNGRTLTTDGPFAETKEQLGGYFLVEAEDLDAAIVLAARMPAARSGCIEVRPLWQSAKAAT